MSPAFDWTDGIVAIIGRERKPVGTGFVISSDGHIATCAHVLDHAGWPYGQWDEEVTIRFNANLGDATGRRAQALVQEECFLSIVDGDIAILYLTKPLPEGVEVLPLAAARGIDGHAVGTWGYPALRDTGLAGHGQVVALVPGHNRQEIQFDSSNTTQGYSGGPLWDLEWGRVIGLILQAPDSAADPLKRHPYTNLAAPAEALVQLCPGRLALTPPDSQIAQVTRHIGGAVDDLVDAYTGRPFVGRDESLDELDAWLESGASGRMVVTARAGFGKTALLANWLRRRQDHGDFVAYHFFSDRYEPLRPVANAYAHLLAQLAAYYGLLDETLPEENARPARLRQLIEGHDPGQGRRLIILLDALDECERPFQLALPFNLPAGVFLIASARAGDLKEGGPPPRYLQGWTERAGSLHLSRLPASALAGWLAAAGDGILLDESQDPAVRQKLAAVSDGYPLYLRYLLEDLVEAKRAGRDILAILDQTAGGFVQYVAGQIVLVGEALGDAQQATDLFILLAVARYPLAAGELLELAGLNPFDLAGLPPGVTRWFSITAAPDGQPAYALAHPRLAEEFEKALSGAAGQMRAKLLAWCAAWPDHSSPYALRYYPELLGRDASLEELADLVRDEGYAAAQQLALPAEPDLPARTARIALETAAAQGRAALMAEFLLEYARRTWLLRQVSPLNALRAMPGPAGLAQAVQLADAQDAERRVVWRLLLAWELAGQERLDDGHAVLTGLLSGPLPALDGWRGHLAYRLLRFLALAWPAELIQIAQSALDERFKETICLDLVDMGHWSAAQDVARSITADRERARSLKRMAVIQARRGEIDPALKMAHTIEHPWQKARALRLIAEAQATSGALDAAGETAAEIADPGQQAAALAWVAAYQVEAGQTAAASDLFAQSLALVESLGDARDKTLTLNDIAVALALAGRSGQAEVTIEAALAAAKEIDDDDDRDDARSEIALTEARAGNNQVARQTVSAIEDESTRNEMLGRVAIVDARSGHFDRALQTVALIPDEDDQAWALSVVVDELARAGDFATARATAGQIRSPRDRAWALARLAQAQVGQGQVGAARESLDAARQAVGDTADPQLLASVLPGIAEAMIAAGQAQEANRAFAQATAAAETLPKEAIYSRAEALVDIGLVQIRAGIPDAGRETIARALVAGPHDVDPETLDEAWAAISAVFAGQGDFQEAQDVAEPIVEPERRVRALIDIAAQAARLGDQPRTTGVFAAALAVVDGIRDDDARTDLLGEIGLAQAKSGELDAARAAAGRLDGQWPAPQILTEIAQNLAREGDSDEALATAGEIDDRVLQVETLGLIASTQSAQNDRPSAAQTIAKAREIVAQIDEPAIKGQALSLLAAVQARAGDLDLARADVAAALSLAAKEDDPELRALAYNRIAATLAQAGLVDGALAAAAGLHDDPFEPFILRDIARAQAQAGDPAAAREIARRIDYDNAQIMALAEIAEAQANAGLEAEALSDLAESRDLALQITSERRRSEVLSDIACVLARAGFASRAVHTAGLILTDRQKNLPPIAAALAESCRAAADAEPFAQFIPLCAYSPNTALAGCAAIAQLYPAQAAAVAQAIAAHHP